MRNVLLFLLVIFFSTSVNGQLDDVVNDNPVNIPQKLLSALNKKTTTLNNEMNAQTFKFIQKLRKREERLKRRLYKLDSNATKNLFLLNTERQYTLCLKKMYSDSTIDSSKLSGNYYAHTDTLTNSFRFLKQYPQVMKNSGAATSEIQGSLVNLQQLEAKFQNAEQLKQIVRDRKEQIKQYLLQFTHLPRSVSGLYDDYNKELFYYNQQVRDYQQMLDDPDKLMQKMVSLLERLPIFQEFMKSNSVIASMFPSGGSYGTPQAIAGLQTRNQISQMMGTQLAGPNAQSAMNENIGDAQSQLSSIRDRLQNYGQGGADMDMPNFKPNTQKTKSFLKRLEYGTNIQTQSSNYFFPATTDLGLSVGYKLNDKGSAIGFGGSVKVGWGHDVSHLSISGQGASLRSYSDIKLKGSFYASGGLEYNYQSQFYSGVILKNFNSWQQSGLVGISKIISVKTKVLKKTKLQLLWDFLSYDQIPKTQPLKFRVGYSF